MHTVAIVHGYLEESLAPGNFFFLTITAITMKDTKLIMTTAATLPAIAGTGDELEEDDEPFIGDDCITIRIICYDKLTNYCSQ